MRIYVKALDFSGLRCVQQTLIPRSRDENGDMRQSEAKDLLRGRRAISFPKVRVVVVDSRANVPTIPTRGLFFERPVRGLRIA